MAFVHHDAVILIDGRRGRIFCCVEQALHHALYGGDMHGGSGIRRLFFQFLDAEGVGKGLKIFHARVFEGVGRLFAQGRTVNQKQDAPETFRLEQPVNQRDTGLGFASAGCHRQQHLALASFDSRFGGANGILLIRA